MDQRSNIAPEVHSKAIPVFRIGSKVVYQLCGAEDDGSGNSGQGNGNNSGEGSGSTGGANQGEGNGQQGGDGSSGAQKPKTFTEAEYAALEARMKAADRAKLAAEARVQEFEGKGKTDLEKAQADLAAAQKQVEDLTSKLSDGNVTNEFLQSNKYSWHNNSAALKLLDRELITIEDNGAVKGMEAAIDKLAKDHPYLVKTNSSGDGKDGKNGAGKNGGNGQKQSGASNNGSGGGGKTEADKAALQKRFPVLRGR